MNPTLPPFVQELFDRGIDPIEDPATQEWLLEHPEALASFAALRDTLSELTKPDWTSQRSRPRRGHPVAWLTAAAAAIALGLFSLDWFEPTDRVRIDGQPAISQLQPLPRPDFSSTGSVIHCRAVATEIHGTNTRRSVVVFANPVVGKRSSTRDYSSPPTASWHGPATVRVTTTVEEALIP